MNRFPSPINIYIAVNVSNIGVCHGGSAAVLEYRGFVKEVLSYGTGFNYYDHILMICTQALETLKYSGLTVVIHTNNKAFIGNFNDGSMRRRINGRNFDASDEYEALRARLCKAAAGFDASACYDAGFSPYASRARHLAKLERLKSESVVRESVR